MENPRSWIDALPDFPAFVNELTDWVMKQPGGMQHWAMSQWGHRADPRGQALDMIQFAEQSEAGKALVAAWRERAHPAPAVRPEREWPEPALVLRRARSLVEESDPLLAQVFKAAEGNVIAQALMCGRCDYAVCHRICNLIAGDELLASTLHLARAIVEYDEQNGGPAERVAEVFDDLGHGDLAEQVRGGM